MGKVMDIFGNYAVGWVNLLPLRDIIWLHYLPPIPLPHPSLSLFIGVCGWKGVV